jgi:hypothetical protein
MEKIREQLSKNGVVVVKNVLPKDKLSTVFNFLADQKEKIKAGLMDEFSVEESQLINIAMKYDNK